MFQIRDTDAGLSLSLTVEPEPRNPRLVDNNVFQIVSWLPGLGDPHAWASPEDLLHAMSADKAAVFPLYRVETKNGPILLRSYSDNDTIAGYAVATYQQLCLSFGLDEITRAIRDDVMEEAEAVCLGELQAYDDFICGNVFRFEILNARRDCLEARRDLYGEEHARHIAQVAFDQHLFGVAMNG